VDLHTARLVLRRWEHDDAARVLDLYGRLEVVRWLGDGPPRVMETLDQAHAAVDRWAERSVATPLGFWAAEVLATGVVAGTVLLAQLPGTRDPVNPEVGHERQHEVELAWHFHPDSWGHGYATEAAAALLAHGFAGGLPRIWALTHLDNDRSRRLCERIGLRHVGREQPWYDVAMEVYLLTAEEYDAR
jgi:RimJ/RimL family protein N-acetyltransferase